MTSNKRQLANMRNSKLGGVKTNSGKQIIKYNAVTHGILKESLSEYEKGYYQDCLATLIEELQPVGFLESLLVERIAVCYIRIYRIAKAEGEFMKSKLNPITVVNHTSDILASLTAIKEEITVTGYQPQIDSQAIQELNNTIIRYDTAIENKLYKSLHELQRLQGRRKGEEVPIPTAVDLISDRDEDK